jgi:predicted DNA-binding ribbon-helix-helix protein
MEAAFWDAAKDIANKDDLPIARLVEQIDESRPPHHNLSSAIRMFVLNHYVLMARSAP